MKETILNSVLTISLIIGAIAGFKIFKWLRSHFVFIGTPLGFITAFVACSMFPAMLVYGVLGGTINEVDKTVSNITKPKYEKYIDDISLENKVSKDTPESFIWHTFDDNSVPLENTLLLVEALRKNNVKFEYHVFPDGCHGLGLGTKETATKGGKHYQPEVYAWTSLFKQWMDRYDK